ncbi:hypothetical protein C0J52_12731 [Blattella germanica]|nr:hypothetical protein C0J52_12731 [Blattella germanica]
MDEQPEKTNNLQEGSQSSVKMKVESSDADSSSCNKDGNKASNSPFTQGISASRSIFGASPKLGSPVTAPRLSFSFGSSNPFGPKSTSSFGAAPKLSSATSSFGTVSSPTKSVFLRPSQLAVSDSPQASNSTFPLKPSSLGNPFARVITENEDESSKEDKPEETSDVSKTSSDSSSSANTESCKTDSSVNANETIDKSPQKTDSGSGSSSSSSSSSSSVSRSSKGIMPPPKFVPLGTPTRHPEESTSSNANIAPTNSTNASVPSASSTSSSNVTGFVFGQNLHERVAEAVTSEAVDSSSRTSELAGTSNNVSNLSASATTNGTSEMLFTSVIKKDHVSENNHNSSNSNNETGEKPSKSLSEAAREYEEARAVKRKYEEVQVITGEEDEVNVLQMNCKLFAFDKTGGTWVERGRGTLRLNDKDSGSHGSGMQSRVVIRTTGTLRVVLNTKIWAGMSVDRPSPKSVRLTAMDNSGQIKVFLVMSSPKETEQLHRSLECRVLLAQRASSSQNQIQSETKSSGNDLASHSLPPEPCSKKRLSEDSSPTPGKKIRII